ncbi:UDP-N-acetylmuramate--L-alanine ligase [bioreactor metagenome]|uniref:UDP-N-acetylmuramate--L-alanine ligase n=1 Tax=bioreactor metagenome TaxID=1076179 RepID=A0A644T3Z1_9ZZZZ|nr:UDP-N-acetylmuramate--L-alanine ligase [Negativicutes bacterium]
MLKHIRKFHFIGIGGSGMSAIATILLQMGYDISGSDMSASEATQKLQRMGARVYIGHHEQNLSDTQAVVVSTAIPDTNPEVLAAKLQNIQIYHRSDVVSALMDERKGIAVAGAHGKTTTTSMIAVMLEKAGIDPTFIIGGEVGYLGGNAKLGAGSWLVAEADESDGSFLKLSPEIAVVTNIENDHMDFYQTMENILHTFEEFLLKIPQDSGLAVLCFDNSHIRDMARNLDRKFISYAIDYDDAEYRASNIRAHGAATIFEVYRFELLLGTMQLDVPGRHNVANCLAAIAVGIHLGLQFDQIVEGLGVFQGAKRRFQTKAKLNGIWVVDDYAHHPTEIATTLLAARQTTPKRLICVFQPHRFSRTMLLRKEFGSAFAPADLLILTDIYAAGERPIPGINGGVIKEEVEKQAIHNVVYIQDKDKIARYLSEITEPGDLVITMGAGNVYQVGEELIELLVKK